MLWAKPDLLRKPVLAFNDIGALAAAEIDRAAADPSSRGTGFLRLPVSEEFAKKFYRTDIDIREYDPDCYYIYTPNLRNNARNQDHPAGGFPLWTNSLGIRRDTELSITKPKVRVVVAGDSHVDGVCSNAENLCSLIERDLCDKYGEDAAEVLNFANGGYSFYNYLGVLHRVLRLGIEIDAFVLIVYGGNDFANTHLWHHFRGEAPPMATAQKRLAMRNEIIAGEDAGHFGQYMLQVEYARSRPREIPIMRQMAREVTEEMQRLCDANNIDFLVAFLPSPLQALEQAPKEASTEPTARMMAKLNLKPKHLEILKTNADHYLATLGELGIEAVDLRPHFQAQTQILYWKSDSHINLAGHRVVADVLRPWVEARIPR